MIEDYAPAAARQGHEHMTQFANTVRLNIDTSVSSLK
jgi:hypothetical protein